MISILTVLMETDTHDSLFTSTYSEIGIRKTQINVIEAYSVSALILILLVYIVLQEPANGKTG